MRIRTRLVLAGAVLASATSTMAQGPAGVYYLTAGDESTNWRVQGTAPLGSWGQGVGGEYPIAVNGDIRTTGTGPGGLGSQYTLLGVDTGVRYANGASAGSFYDGATDGTHNYALDWSSGSVYQFDANWGNGTFLFGGLGGGNYLGITYDPFSNALWISGWNGSSVEKRSLNGTLLSSFNAPFSDITALAMDYSDGTLWFGTQSSTWGVFYQYSTSGQSLGQVRYPDMVNQNTLGGEFNFQPVPEPASLLVLAGAAFCIRRRK